MTNDTSALQRAYRTWEARSEFRSNRRRFKNYAFGNQWADLIADSTSESDQLVNNGRKPITNNLIRRLVKTILGRWRASVEETPLTSLDARLLEEYLISGAAIQRVGLRSDGSMKVENVSPDMFFVNRHYDPEGRDAAIVGQLHSLTLDDILRRFAHADKSRARKIARMYSDPFASFDFSVNEGSETDVSPDFLTARSPAGVELFRVVEVWTRESKEVYICHDPERPEADPFPLGSESELNAENRRRRQKGRRPLESRWTLQTGWYVRFYAPTGDILAEGYSPYPHRSHPYAFGFYPLTDGEIHSFVEDLVEQQRYINRLIVSIDHTMQTSAKGVLLFPTDQLVPGMSLAEVAKRWAQPEGLIPVSGRGKALPQQVVNSSKDSSAYLLLELQMKLFEQISGVSDALLGRQGASNAGAALYNAQAENSATSLTDMLATFSAILRRRDAKGSSLSRN